MHYQPYATVREHDATRPRHRLPRPKPSTDPRIRMRGGLPAAAMSPRARCCRRVPCS